MLWAVEEALRAASVALVIAEPERPLSLTAGRWLQLAAEAGRTTGLLLTRAGAGSNAAQTRWHCAPVLAAAPGSILHDWALSKSKIRTTGRWSLHWDNAAAAFHLVSALGERREPAQLPG